MFFDDVFVDVFVKKISKIIIGIANFILTRFQSIFNLFRIHRRSPRQFVEFCERNASRSYVTISKQTERMINFREFEVAFERREFYGLFHSLLRKTSISVFERNEQKIATKYVMTLLHRK